MLRSVPTTFQNFLSSVILPCLSVFLLPVSILAVLGCIVTEKLRSWNNQNRGPLGKLHRGSGQDCVIISGGRMTKGLTLARAFKRAGWKVIGVEEQGWGDLCPMRFSNAVDHFYLLPPAANSYALYSATLSSIAKQHSAKLFIPVSGAGSSVEDAHAAEEMSKATNGKCRTFIQDPETMLDLHDKERFTVLVNRLGNVAPYGRKVGSVDEAMDFLLEEGEVPRFILKCMGLDENRGDITLYPLEGDDERFSRTRQRLDQLTLKITKDCPYVFQEFIRGREWCTHASVIDGRITSFVTCPSNDMLMTYEDATLEYAGRGAELWTKNFLLQLQNDPTPSGRRRHLTGHFSFDFIESCHDGALYPLECNARVHTAIILLPVSDIAACYAVDQGNSSPPLRPFRGTLPRSWLYNDLIVNYLPLFLPSHRLLRLLHPSLPACITESNVWSIGRSNASLFRLTIDPTLVTDDWLPFIVFWHVWWPTLLLTRWWQGKKWTRLNVSTGRIFEA